MSLSAKDVEAIMDQRFQDQKALDQQMHATLLLHVEEVKKDHLQISNILRGPSGDSGLVGDVQDIKAIVKDVACHGKTLYGSEGRNGLVGDVRDIKTTARVLKWFAGIGGVSGVTAWATRIWEDMWR